MVPWLRVGDPLIGHELGGYRVDALLGRGGQAVVYRAHQVRLRRDVALKVVVPGLADDEAFRARFAREGVAAASLAHPSIVRIYDAGEAEGTAWLAMELVEGETLETRLYRDGAMSPEAALACLTPLAEALDFAHARGFVHRDVKPANVLLGSDGRVLLSDFGLTKAASQTAVTGSGVWMGTPQYMSPEAVRGAEVGPASDRYSLAVVAFEVLTGRAPFADRETAALLYAHVYEAPPAASSIRPELGPAVDLALERGLRKAPEARPPSGRALVDGLREALARSPAARTEEGETRALPPRRTRSGRGRRRGVLAAAWASGAAVIAAAVVSVVLVTRGGGDAGASGGAAAGPTGAAATPTPATTTAAPPTGTSGPSAAEVRAYASRVDPLIAQVRSGRAILSRALAAGLAAPGTLAALGAVTSQREALVGAAEGITPTSGLEGAHRDLLAALRGAVRADRAYLAAARAQAAGRTADARALVARGDRISRTVVEPGKQGFLALYNAARQGSGLAPVGTF
jgi:protein kinase-like protein